MRLGICYLMDQTGIVDHYIDYMLVQMRNVCDELFVFVSDRSDKKQIQRLENVVGKVIHYDNITYVGRSFLQMIGADTLKQYDSVVIFDDKIIGPFFPVSDMFEVMEYQNLDFWGIMRNYMRYESRKLIQEQMFPHFVVLNRQVLLSEVFERFLALKNNGAQIVSDLIAALEYAGFQWDTYSDTTAYRGCVPDENVDIGIMYAYELLKYQHCPFVYCEALRNTYFLPGGDEIPYLTLEYIRKHTNYDIKMIWDHLLRTTNMLDLKKALHLEYVLPSDCRIKTQLSQAEKKTAVIIHLYYDDLVEACFEYVKEIPTGIDVFILSSKEETRNAVKREIVANRLKNCKVMVKNNRGRDFSALLVAAKDIVRSYDYICFIHDKKSHAGSPVSSGKSWMYSLWECMLKDRDYIWNILDTFEQNASLGMLVPPEPFHSEAIGGIGWTWAKNYETTVELARRLKIDCILDPDKHPIALGTVFWCRREALAVLFDGDFEYEDFPEEPLPIDGTICHAMERILGYIPQTAGYYTAYVMPPEFAALRGTKLNTYMTEAMTILRDENIWDRQDGGVIFDPNKHIRPYLGVKNLLRFCMKCREVYIYGAGIFGKKCCETLQLFDFPIEAFVVTSKSGNLNEVMGVPVISFEELQNREKNVGIIVALKRKFREEVVPALQEAEYHNLFFFPDEN